MNSIKDNGVEIYLKHKTTLKQKGRRDWYESMIDHYIDLGESLNDKSVTENNIKAAQGIIGDDVYKEVLKQVNDKNMGVKVKELNLLDDVDIITPIKERYMGEFVRTPNFYTATVEGEDISLAMKSEVQKKVYDILLVKLTTQLKKMEDELVANELPDEEVQQKMAQVNIKEEIKKIKEEFFQAEAIKAKNIVDYFVADIRFEESLAQLFFYFFATEEAYVEFDPRQGTIGYRIIPPQEYLRIPTKDSVFTEDDKEGVIKTQMTIREILDEFEEELSKDDIAYLETLLSEANAETSNSKMRVAAEMIYSRYIDWSDMSSSIKTKLGTQKDSVFANSPNLVDTYKVFYTTKRKYGILSYMGPIGRTEILVGDTYKLNKEYGDISIKWEWEDEVHVSYRFGSGDGVGVYIKPKPIKVQRNEATLKNSCKIPIVGINALLNNFGRKPIPARMLSHQAMYVIFTNKYRKEIAKFQGFVNLIAESILSDSNSFTQNQRLEYMYKDNLLIFNDAEIDVNTLQSLRTIGNTGQAEYINTLAAIRRDIKDEAWDLANMNSERYGSIDTKGGMANTQEAIRRVSTGSVLLFTMFDMLKERLYQAISDYGRITYIDGIKTDFQNKLGEIVELDVNHEELISAEIGIHFTVNAIEKEKVDMMRNAAVSANIQSGNLLDAINVVEDNDLSSLKVHAKRLQDAKNAREEQLQKAEQDANKYVEDKKSEVEGAKLKGKLDEADLKGKYDLLAKDKDIYMVMLEIQANRENMEAGLDSNANGIADNGDNGEFEQFDSNMKYLETQIKQATLELTKAKVKNEKSKPRI